jgi:hypothetical protein
VVRFCCVVSVVFDTTISWHSVSTDVPRGAKLSTITYMRIIPFVGPIDHGGPENTNVSPTLFGIETNVEVTLQIGKSQVRQ